jgi:hypothetical protein
MMHVDVESIGIRPPEVNQPTYFAAVALSLTPLKISSVTILILPKILLIMQATSTKFLFFICCNPTAKQNRINFFGSMKQILTPSISALRDVHTSCKTLIKGV